MQAEELVKLRAFFESPDGIHDWDGWIRMLLEEMLVIDAATVYVARDNAGTPISLEAWDGATINVVIDKRGRPVGYQQILHGVPGDTFDASELVYWPRNVRTHKVYGFSPVEQCLPL